MSNESPAHNPLLANDANPNGPVASGGVTAQEAAETTAGEESRSGAAADNTPAASRLPADVSGLRAASAVPASLPAAEPGRSESIGGGRNGTSRAPAAAASVTASECACNGGKSKDYVFAIGVLGYDFGT